MRARAVKIASRTRASLSRAKACARAGTASGWSAAARAAAHRASGEASASPTAVSAAGLAALAVSSGVFRIRGMEWNQLLQFVRDLLHRQNPVRAASLNQFARHAPDHSRLLSFGDRPSP